MAVVGVNLFNSILILGFWVLIIYVVITIIKSMKQRNEYLKDIRDELRKRNEQ